MLLGKWVTADVFSYSDSPSFSWAVRYNYSVDLDNDGYDELIFAGFETQPNTPANYDNTKMAIFGWSNGQFRNITSQWLPGGLDSVEGVGDIAIGDFNGDHLTDLYLSAYADMDFKVNAYQLLNTGSSFNKVSFGLNQWEHGVASGDLNDDGYDDVLPFSYLPPFFALMGGPSGLTKTPYFADHWPDSIMWATRGSGGALGDFYGDGTVSLVVVDNYVGTSDTMLYRPAFSAQGTLEGFGQPNGLPEPVWSSLSHDVRARAFDFTDDGLLDILVFSRKWWDGTQWPVASKMQFLENKGDGQFEDVTSNVLTSYNEGTNVAYAPVFRDFNKDGLVDIFLSDSSWASENLSTAILLQQQNGTFAEQGRQTLSAGLQSSGGMAGIVYGPDDSFYIVSESHARGGAAHVKFAPLYFPERNQSESLRGTRGDDSVFGMSGDDTFTSSFGNDFIDGGTGFDTVEIASLFEDVTGVALAGDGSGVKVTSAQGRDSMINVERVQFLDASYAPTDLLDLLPISPEFSIVTNGVSAGASPTLFRGDASLNLQYQLIDKTPGAIIAGSALNDFIVLQGGGNKAVNGGLGNDVIDGGTGSTFVSGGGGANTFFLDGRASGVSWSTITDFQLGDGDKATIWGWKEGVSRVKEVVENGGAAGYTGLTLHFENLLPDGSASTARNASLNSITFTDKSLSDFGAESVAELNQQIIEGSNSHFIVGATNDVYGEHGYLYIS
jgi:Ca2+-binding RTX toxin-like protein